MKMNGSHLTPLVAATFDWAQLGPILLPLAAGAGSIYLLLPRPRPYPKLWGALLGGLALLLAGGLLLRPVTLDAEAVLFYAFSAIALVSGTLLVTQHNPARAALSFSLVVLSTCGLYLLLAAPFLMAATVIIYAGAIVVTFLFVLMLAQQEGRSDADDRSREPLLATVTGFTLLGVLLTILTLSYGASPATREIDDLLDEPPKIPDLGAITGSKGRPERFSNLSGPSPAVAPTELRRDERGRPHLPAENSAYLGRSLFTDYLLPVELGGTLLLVATVGAIAIAQRRTTPGRLS
jgi:NADH-quinone oxidoreductase subunit J